VAPTEDHFTVVAVEILVVLFVGFGLEGTVGTVPACAGPA